MTAGAPTDRFQRLVWFVCYYGMATTPGEMSPTELAKVTAVMHQVDRENSKVPTRILTDAIQYGMAYVFPISENGYFDAHQVLKYLPQAKAAASKLRLQGKIPITPEAAMSRIDRMAAEDEWND